MTRRLFYKIPTRHNVDLPWLWCAGCSFELIVWSLSYYHSPAFHTLPTSWINSENLLGQDLCHIFNRKFQGISQGFVAFTVSQKLYLVCLWRWQDIGHWTLKWPMSSIEYVTCVKQFLSTHRVYSHRELSTKIHLPKSYAHSSHIVMLCCAWVVLDLIHILQGYYSGTMLNRWLLQYQLI